jgi:glucokinase
MSLLIGIDLGGTNIKAVLIRSADGVVVAKHSSLTLDGDFIETGVPLRRVPQFAATVLELVQSFEKQAGHGALQVGLSAPGLANPNGRQIDLMPGRMHGLEGFDWPDFLQRDVRVVNDAHAALMGEVWCGAARGCNDAFMITLGTGVGGAIWSGGRLLRGHIGRGGHLGHISLNADGPQDIFNTPSSLESFLGNKTLVSRCSGRFQNTLDLIGAVAAGDEKASQIWLESVRHLAVGIASLINVLDPEVVVVGGGIASGAGDLLLAPLQRYLDDYEWRPGGHRVRLSLATAGEWAGAIGAAYHALNKN